MTDSGADPRIERLLDLVLRLASGDLSARLEISPARDDVDGLITGVNMLAEELEVLYVGLEQRVAERTALLHQSHLEVQRLALTDALTGLANRTLFNDRAEQAVARGERGATPPAALLLDLDGFKAVNDSFGHAVGDAVLVEVARRLATVARSTDTVARLGGDEFAVLITDATAEDARKVADRTLEVLRSPVHVGDQVVGPGASIGLRLGLRGQSVDSLMRDADTAMYAAKARGRRNIQVFHPAMHAAALARTQFAAEVGAALADGALSLHLEPRLDLSSRALVGAEATGRWLHPRRGLLTPAELIPDIGQSGLTVALGQWLLHESIAQLALWQADLDDLRPFRLHVLLPHALLRRPGFADQVQQTLERHHVAAGHLGVEIAGGDLVTDASLLDTLSQLRSLGVSLTVDQLGTGSTSVSELRRLPIDAVTIHQPLIENIATDPGQDAFVGALLRLVDSLQLDSVAKGVTTPPQLARLVAWGCRFGQGSALRAPLPAADMLDLLTQRPSWAGPQTGSRAENGARDVLAPGPDRPQGR